MIDGNVEDDDLTENVLLGRDILCHKGSRLVIEGDVCRLELANDIKKGKDMIKHDENENRSETSVSTHCDVFTVNASELENCPVTQMEIKLTTDVNINPNRLTIAKNPIINKVDELPYTNEILSSDSPVIDEHLAMMSINKYCNTLNTIDHFRLLNRKREKWKLRFDDNFRKLRNTTCELW